MTVIITGGAGAIGSMCAYEAAKRKYDILLCYNKNEEGAKKVCDMLAGFESKIVPLCADITTAQGRQKISDAAEKMGGADILINNAGVASIMPFCDTDDNMCENMCNVNLMAHINLTRELLPQMIKKQAGAVVNVSSVWGVTGASCEVLYSAAKAGIIGFTKALAKELAPSHITVNAVAPGCIDSAMLEGFDKDELCDMIPLGRTGNGLEVARAVFFLAEHGYITGQTLSVDGGMHI